MEADSTPTRDPDARIWVSASAVDDSTDPAAAFTNFVSGVRSELAENRDEDRASELPELTIYTGKIPDYSGVHGTEIAVYTDRTQLEPHEYHWATERVVSLVHGFQSEFLEMTDRPIDIHV